MRISDWSSDVCSSDLHRLLTTSDHETRRSHSVAIRATARRPACNGGCLRSVPGQIAVSQPRPHHPANRNKETAVKRKLLIGAGLVGAALLLLANPAAAQEAEEVAPASQVVLDNIFVFVCGILVFFMQAGFALVEAGLTRAKNVSNIMMKNLMDGMAGVLAFALVGDR